MANQKKSYNLVIGVVALILIILLITLVGYFVSRPKAPVIQGEAEATEYRVSGKVPGRVEALYVKEGDYVHKGDTVVCIDSPEVQAKLLQARGALAAASAQRNKAVNGARQEQITGAYELWQQAAVQEEVLRKSLERVQKLYDEQVISAQKYDETKARYDAAVAQTKAAKSQYDMALAGARREDREAAQAVVDRAQGAMQEVESYLGELYLTAPADGIISVTYPKVGELVGTGSPIMTVTDIHDVWFTFNVREDALHGLKQGDKITVRIPALDDRTCEATVTYLSVLASYATWKATKETDGYDAKTFEVRAVPDQPVDDIRPGMTVLLNETKK